MRNQLLSLGVLLLGLSTALATFSAKAELSGTVDLKQTNSNSIFGAVGERFKKDVSVQVNGGASQSVSAGLFRVTDQDTMAEYLAYCIEIPQTLGLPTVYDVNQIIPVAGVVSLLDKLFTNFVAGVDSAVKGAAFQIAVWEIIYDGGVPDLNLNNGSFKLASAGQDVINQSNAYLANLANLAGGDYDLHFLTDSERQDLIIHTDNLDPSVVSAPATLAFILMGFGAMVFASRKSS